MTFNDDFIAYFDSLGISDDYWIFSGPSLATYLAGIDPTDYDDFNDQSVTSVEGVDWASAGGKSFIDITDLGIGYISPLHIAGIIVDRPNSKIYYKINSSDIIPP